MLTLGAATAIGRSCLAGNKADIESGAVVVVVVVVVYSIILPCESVGNKAEVESSAVVLVIWGIFDNRTTHSSGS